MVHEPSGKPIRAPGGEIECRCRRERDCIEVLSDPSLDEQSGAYDNQARAQTHARWGILCRASYKPSFAQRSEQNEPSVINSIRRFTTCFDILPSLVPGLRTSSGRCRKKVWVFPGFAGLPSYREPGTQKPKNLRFLAVFTQIRKKTSIKIR